MTLLHGRWRRRTALLALGALDEDEAVRARAHVATCAACARDLEETRSALSVLSADPVHGAEPPIPLGALVTRVQARLDETPARERAWPPLLAGAAAGWPTKSPWTTRPRKVSPCTTPPRSGA